MKDTIYFQTKAFSEIKEADNEDVIIEWFASTKDIDRYGDIVKPSAFKEAIDDYMKNNPIMLLQHNQDKPIGKFTEAKITAKWLKVKWTISNDLENVKDNVRNWILKGFSIWFIVKAWSFKEVDWIEVREITDVELLEISVVAVPANPFTLFQAVKKYFNTLNEKDMKKDANGNIIEDEILDDEQKEVAKEVEQGGDVEDETTDEEVETETTVNPDNEETEEETEELDELEKAKSILLGAWFIVTAKDAGEAHELHNETISDNSEKSSETDDNSEETETEEASENEEETVEDEKNWEDGKEEVDLKSLVEDLILVVEKQTEIIETQKSAINSVWLKKGLATISTKETTDTKDSWNKSFLNAFKNAKTNINY